MALWREEKYLRLVSPQLDNFKQRHTHTFNFRCPLCGDSQKVKSKTRGYVYPKGDIYMFKCHNCQVSLPFSALLKRLSKTLYDEYLMEKLKEREPIRESPVETQKSPVVRETNAALVTSLGSCSMPTNALYSVWSYAKSRKIPDSALKRLFGTLRAREWLLPLVGPEKAKKVHDNVPYLVLPFRLQDRSWFGCQVRALNTKEYVTFRWAQEPLKVFGLEVWNPQKPTLIVEGPIDSLFVPNALAICGSDLLGGVRVLEHFDILTPHMARTYVWDNEPRNQEVCHNIDIAVKLTEPVVIWPRHYPKDINDMIMAGLDVTETIRTRTFMGLGALLEFESWKR